MKLPTELASYFDVIREKRQNQALLMLAGDFSNDGIYDLITDCFLNNDPVLFGKAIPWLREALKESNCMDNVVRLERDRLEQLSATDPHNRHTKQMLSVLSAETLREQALRTFDEFCSTMSAAEGFTDAQCHENYFFTKLLRIVYDAHCLEQSKLKRFDRAPTRSTSLYQYYQAAGIDLLKKDLQYSKYNLYSITAETELLIGLPCRILDPHQPLQLLIEDTPEHVLELFERLRKDRLIQGLALLASQEALIETDKRIFVTLGFQEIQQPLTLQNLPRQPREEVIHTVVHRSSMPIDGTTIIPSASKFCEPGSDDITWCLITPSSMTFEEIAHVPELFEDCAVTRMIHLEYFVKDGNLYISHIDHEYIFYTHEEFDLRAEDPHQKGNARKRMKTFKIDHSAIPFVLDDSTLFIHTLIQACFDRPHLLMNFLTDMLFSRN